MSEDEQFINKLYAILGKLMNKRFMSFTSHEVETIYEAVERLEGLSRWYSKKVWPDAEDAYSHFRNCNKDFFTRMSKIKTKIRKSRKLLNPTGDPK